MKTELSNVADLVGRWRKVPLVLMGVGGLGAAVGWVANPKQLAYSYLLAFMFFLSLCLGGLFLVVLHHLFDASWSVSLRRVNEHLACSVVVLAVCFVPLALLAPQLYDWTHPAHPDLVLQAKAGYLNVPGFYARAVLYFVIWTVLAWRLRFWSLEQDQTGAARCTYKMRALSAAGAFLLAWTVTLAVIDWVKTLQPHWYSTMYGVYYWSGAMWVTLVTVYLLAVWLRTRAGLRELIQLRQLHDLGMLILTFTVFNAYVHFAQYFIIWNANLPEETFWYLLREKGYWWGVGLALVFGHFLLPFLLLLRIDAKLKLGLMIPLCLWAWAMHFLDLSYNVLPTLHPSGFPWRWTDAACFLFLGGAVAWVFLRELARHPVYPLKDPRLKEALTVHPVPPPAISEAIHQHENPS